MLANVLQLYSIFNSHAIDKLCLAVFLYGHMKARRKCARLLRLKVRRDHSPVAVYWLVDSHSDGRVLVIAYRYLVGVFIDAAVDCLEIGLLSFGYNVEGIADFEAHRLVLRRMLNAVFAYELLCTIVVLLVETNRSGGQRHPQLILLGVDKLYEDADFVFNHRARIIVAVIVARLAVDFELLRSREASS